MSKNVSRRPASWVSKSLGLALLLSTLAPSLLPSGVALADKKTDKADQERAEREEQARRQQQEKEEKVDQKNQQCGSCSGPGRRPDECGPGGIDR